MVDKSELFGFLAKRIGEVLKSKANRNEKLKTACRLLRDNVSYYNWVGFYVVGKKRKDELLLGARAHLISEWKKTLREVCRVTRRAMFSLYDARKTLFAKRTISC